MRGATRGCCCRVRGAEISIHTPHAGSDCPVSQNLSIRRHFNPHSPCGERRAKKPGHIDRANFNPHSPCGERRYICMEYPINPPISIHTPHAGSDVHIPHYRALILNFNPHSPCGERRFAHRQDSPSESISIHTPHAGSDRWERGEINPTPISIHTPHAGSD